MAASATEMVVAATISVDMGLACPTATTWP
jgi:hypothetical protein